MLPEAKLNDAGELVITGSDIFDHVLVRQTLNSLSVNYYQGSWKPLGKFELPKVKSIVSDLGKMHNFFDAHGVTVPRRIEQGNGQTCDADIWARGGYKFNHVIQQASPDCGHEAGVAAAVYNGIYPSINYVGPTATGAMYYVQYGTTGGAVEFNGTAGDTDLRIFSWDAWWPVIEHRMWLANSAKYGAHAVVIIGYIRGGDNFNAQMRVENHWPLPNRSNWSQIFNRLAQATAMKQIVIMETHFPPKPEAAYAGVGPVHPLIVADHQYAHLASFMENGVPTSIIYNPWGVDNVEGRVYQGKPNDGILKVPTYDVCMYSSQDYRIG